MIKLTHEQIIKELPYALICDIHESARWSTGRRRRLWNEQFTTSEQIASSRLFSKAADWALVTGAPNCVYMNENTYNLWQKLGEFCASI